MIGAACADAALPSTSTPPPSPTLPPTPTPTPAPTPTPSPRTLFEAARRAAFIGDYTTAIAMASGALLGAEPDTAWRESVMLALAQWHLRQNDPDAAMALLAQLARSEDQATRVRALVLQGRTQAQAGSALAATAAYSAALQSDTPLSPWLNWWLGEALLNANQPAEAVPYLRRSVAAAPTMAEEFARREKLAVALQLSGDFDGAVAEYEAILARAQVANYRARILWELAQVLQVAGRHAEAFRYMQALVDHHPRTPQALSALQALLRAGQPVDELQRGIVNYHNRQYALARDAFRRAITATPERANEIRYWSALNYLQMGSPADALRNLDRTIIENPPSSPFAAIALAEKAKLLAGQGRYEEARAALSALLQHAPPDARAAEALLDAAQQLARDATLLADALAAYRRAAELHPNAERAAEALLRVAAIHYRLGQWEAVAEWSRALVVRYPDQPAALSARLWLGKAYLAAGETTSATAVLNALVELAPDSYEGTRAAELLRDPTRAPLSLPFAETLRPVTAAEQQEAERWLREWLSLPEATPLDALREDIRSDARFMRGNWLWELGFWPEARAEFDGLRASFGRDPLALYQLVLHFQRIGAYRASIAAADALMRLSPARTPSQMPRFLAALLYPTYYAELVLEQARAYALDPLLIFALIRQESLFEPFAVSPAAASGLMQVIPSTGREIYNELRWPPGYTSAELQKPIVSVRFGTHYLAKQRNFFGGDLYAALAAYNGGPGNSLRWKERSGGDPDLFYLNITFDETRTYIRTVGANYAIYHRIYAPE